MVAVITTPSQASAARACQVSSFRTAAPAARLLADDSMLGFTAAHCLKWEFKGKRRASAHPIAVRGQRSAQFFRRQRTAVQAEAVAVFLGGKPVGENAHQIFGRDA